MPLIYNTWMDSVSAIALSLFIKPPWRDGDNVIAAGMRMGYYRVEKVPGQRNMRRLILTTPEEQTELQ